VPLDPCLPLTADGPLRTHPEDCVKDNSSCQPFASYDVAKSDKIE